MNYYGAKEFVSSFRTVRGNTLQIAEDIPEDKYDFVPGEGARPIGRLLTHIALGYRFQHQIHQDRLDTLEGIDWPSVFEKINEEEAKPRTKQEIITLLRTEGDIWANFVEGAAEDFLAESVTMPEGATPPAKSRFEMILSVKEHEMHHRGQLMAAERLIGVVPHLTRAMNERMAEAQAAKANG